MIAQFLGLLEWPQTFAVLFMCAAFVAVFVLPQVILLRRRRAEQEFEVKRLHEQRVASDTQLIDARRSAPYRGEEG
jgi:hypothetical protein